MSDKKYNLWFTPRWYFTKISADLLPSVSQGTWLTAWSQNVLIWEDGTLETRKGQTLLGTGGVTGGISWAETWTTNTNSERAMRTIFDTLQVYYEDEWYDVKTWFGNNINFCGGGWFDRSQSRDRYVWVNWTPNIYSWQGGITRVASRVSATQLKKENGGTPTSKSILITAGTSITWGYPLGTQNQVTRNSLSGTVANFWDAGFRAGDTIDVTVTGIVGTYTIASVNIPTNEILITGDFASAGTISTVGEWVVGTVNAYWPLAKTWAQERFWTPQVLGTTTMTIATPCVVTYTSHNLVAGDTIYFETTGALPTGLVINTNYFVISAGLTTNTFQISATRGGTAINTTWGQSWIHTLYKTTQMNFIMNGVSYTYTGGYNTDTLTGVVPALPWTVDDGTLVFSDVQTNTPSGWDFTLWATPDVMAVSRNQVFLWDTDSNWLWISNQENFYNYSYTVPVRINWEGWSASLDKNIIAIATNDTDNSVRVSCGTDTWYPITFQVASTSTTPGELVIAWTPKRGSGVGANNQFSVCNTKQGMLYLSQEPTFDYLQNVLQFNQVTLPVGDPIETDLQSLDLTWAKTLYWRNYVWLLLPSAGFLYGYDMIRQLWQPPQTVGGNCLSIIDWWLAVHSTVKNETYKMFDGTNDNENPISFIGVISYSNWGRRDAYKWMDGYFVEAKVTPWTEAVTFWVNLGYKGSGGNYNTTFGSDDWQPFVDTSSLVPWFGGSSFGQSPFGSFFTSDEVTPYRKVRKILPMIKNWNSFFEMQSYFSCDSLNAQFKILAHWPNMELSWDHNWILIDNN